jgi:predicted transcriptional regulator
MAWKTALRAADIMTRRMITVDSNASIREVAVVLVDNEISGAPVRDELGRITGLISLRDIARYERERPPGAQAALQESDADIESAHGVPWGYHVEPADLGRVREFMTPIVIALPEEAPLADVVRAMLERRVHRILVRNDEGDIVGIISAIDVLRAVSGQERARQPASAAPVGTLL